MPVGRDAAGKRDGVRPNRHRGLVHRRNEDGVVYDKAVFRQPTGTPTRNVLASSGEQVQAPSQSHLARPQCALYRLCGMGSVRKHLLDWNL